MKFKSEIAFTSEKMSEVLANLPADAILVGGQSLVFWISYYRLPRQGGPAISKDADILGKRSDVAMIADALGGIAEYPPQRSITIIAGQIFIPVGDHEFMNIDVIHSMGSMDKLAIRNNAVRMNVTGKDVLVMHPLDVLDSRARNYYSIKNKQNEPGLRQVSLATEVAIAYMSSVAFLDESLAMQSVERIFAIARSPAGRYARQHGVEVFEAIRPAFLSGIISNKAFLAQRLPRLEADIRSVLGCEADSFFTVGAQFTP